MFVFTSSSAVAVIVVANFRLGYFRFPVSGSAVFMIAAFVAVTSSQVRSSSSSSAASSSAAILPAHVLLKADPPLDGVVGGGGGNGGTSGVGGGSGKSGRRKKVTATAARARGGGKLRSRLTIRPSPSDDLPVLPLRYPDSGWESTPSDSDLDPAVLRSLLGANFDTDFMAIARPAESIRHPNGTYVYDDDDVFTGGGGRLKPSRKKSNRSTTVHQQAGGQSLSSTTTAAEKDGDDLPPAGGGAKIRLGPFNLPGRGGSGGKRIQIKNRKNRKSLQRYLAWYSYCPVLYRWRDLGRRFWPRWIREGDCGGGGGGGDKRRQRSCSVPAGMTCKPDRSATKTVLWWHCRRTGQCGWIPIKYPVIVGCRCSC